MRTATNPQTGEKLVEIGGEWVPYTQSATDPETGQKAFLVNNKWEKSTLEKPKSRKARRDAPPDTSQREPISAWDLVTGVAEPLMTMGTGAVATGIGGLGALGSAMQNVLAETGDLPIEKTSPLRTYEKALEQYTYQPRTESGRKVVEAIAEPLQKYEDLSEEMAIRSARATGSDPYGAVTYAMMQAAPMILGARGVRPYAAKPGVAKVISAPKGAYRKVAEAIENRLPGGPERAVTSVMRDIYGPRMRTAREALENAVRGQTAGQAMVPAGATEGSALWRMASRQQPSEYYGIYGAQQADRLKALRDIAGSPEKQQFMKNIRKGVSDKMYAAARTGELPETDVKTVLTALDDTIKKNPGNKKFQRELMQFRDGLARKVKIKTTKGRTRVKERVRTDAQEVLSTVDGIRIALEKPEYQPISGRLTALKNEIVNLSDKYKEAQKFYAQTSRPINQQQIAQTLIDVLSPRMGKAERVSPYMTALANEAQTLRKGMERRPVFTELKDYVTEGQLNTFKRIKNELDIDAEFKQQATIGNQRMNQIMGTTFETPKLRVLERAMVILNTVLKRIEGRNAEMTLNRLADLGKPENRKELLKIMKAAEPEEKAVLQRFSTDIAEMAAAGTIESLQKREND